MALSAASAALAACNNRLTCRSCGKSHPRVPYVDRRDGANTDTGHSKEPVACNITASHKTCAHIGAEKDCCLLFIPSVAIQVHQRRLDNTHECIFGSWQYGNILFRASHAKTDHNWSTC